MNTIKKTTLLAACSAIISVGAVAQDQEAVENPRPRREAMQEQRAVRQEHRAETMKIYDENGDGKLDEIERAVLRDDVKAGKITQPPRPRQGRQGERRGLRTPPPEILAVYDANDDGKLDETEHAAVRADIESGKLERPRRGDGPRGGRGPRGARGPGGPRPEVEPEAAE